MVVIENVELIMNLIRINLSEARFYCFILFHLWLCVSCKSNCCSISGLTVEFKSIEPKEIVANNGNVLVYFQSNNSEVNEITVSFLNSSNPLFMGPGVSCFRSTWMAIDPFNSLVNCTTHTFYNFTFNTSLDLYATIYCKNSHVDSFRTKNVTIVVDPEIKGYTKYVLIGQKSDVELNYTNIHERHINQTSLSYGNTICDRVSFKDKTHKFNCLIPQFNQTTQESGSIVEFLISLSGFSWRKLKIHALPVPTIQSTLGSTFAGALNPILIIGSGFPPLFASQLFLMTNYSNLTNKCSYSNETHLSCIAAQGLVPVNLATQVNFTLVLSPTFTVLSKSTFTQNGNPFIISSEFSYSDQQLELILYNYVSYYIQFTTIEIYDADKKNTTPCINLRLDSISTLTCKPSVELSPDYPYSDHVKLKINSWSITYNCINCPTSASSYSKTFIVVGIASALLLSIITSLLICNQLENSNTLGVYKPPVRPKGKGIAEPLNESLIESLNKPIIKALPKPIVKQLDEPLDKTLEKPIVEALPKLLVKPPAKPLVMSLDELIDESIDEPIDKSQLKYKLHTKDNH